MSENCSRLAPLPLPAEDIPDAPPVSQQHFPLEVDRVEKTRAYVVSFSSVLVCCISLRFVSVVLDYCFGS